MGFEEATSMGVGRAALRRPPRTRKLCVFEKAKICENLKNWAGNVKKKTERPNVVNNLRKMELET